MRLFSVGFLYALVSVCSVICHTRSDLMKTLYYGLIYNRNNFYFLNTPYARSRISVEDVSRESKMYTPGIETAVPMKIFFNFCQFEFYGRKQIIRLT